MSQPEFPKFKTGELVRVTWTRMALDAGARTRYELEWSRKGIVIYHDESNRIVAVQVRFWIFRWLVFVWDQQVEVRS